MEQTALRPKPMPGGGRDDGGGARPRAARRRGRRLGSLLFGLFVGTVLVLSGVGLGAVGATVIGVSKLAGVRHAVGAAVAGGVPAREAVLGVEVVDAGGTGAEVVGVHVPGPGHGAGLVRGDVLVAFGGARIGSARDLAREVARARPGRGVGVTVVHRAGGRQRLTIVPGVVV